MSSGNIKPKARNSIIKYKRKPKSYSKSKFLRHIYNSKKWKTLRNEYIRDHKYCEICGEIATQVHHIIPFSTGETEDEIKEYAYDPDNLIALCCHCHISKHRKK